MIPEGVRQRLGLKAGSQFVVVAGDDAVVLKPVAELDMSQFDKLLAEARKACASCRVTEGRHHPHCPKSGMRVVLDTNVVMSGMFFRGAAGQDPDRLEIRRDHAFRIAGHSSRSTLPRGTSWRLATPRLISNPWSRSSSGTPRSGNARPSRRSARTPTTISSSRTRWRHCGRRLDDSNKGPTPDPAATRRPAAHGLAPSAVHGLAFHVSRKRGAEQRIAHRTGWSPYLTFGSEKWNVRKSCFDALSQGSDRTCLDLGVQRL